MKDAAHELRFAGNEVAHGDLAEQPKDAKATWWAHLRQRVIFSWRHLTSLARHVY